MSFLSSVCLIDDDAIYRLLIKKMVETTGCTQTILQFSDGSEALDFFVLHQAEASRLPDLVLLDLEMPFMDGWQFLTQFKELRFSKNIVLYIMSSSTSLEDRERARAFPEVKGYLTKPLTKDRFLAVLNDL